MRPISKLWPSKSKFSEYLRKFEINNLPGFKNKTDKFDSDSYYNWRNLRNGIHKSITTEPGYLEYTIGEKAFRQPVGILNVLMQIKSVNYEEPSVDKLFKWQEFKWDTGSLEDNLQKIYDNRQIYVRFQFNEPYGDSPGGMAVLQIWPPYCCSPIHNHGEAYGVIKVLANQICVQNFKDLNFLNSDRVPYQQNIYQENQYTWLSEFSFGIHRLINTTNQTTLCLQAYQGHKGSKQFFEFIFYKSNPDNKNLKLENSEEGNKIQEKPKKKGKGSAESGNLVNLKQTLQGQDEEQLYCQYYPQHDWKNFLNWKTPQGHQKEFQYLQDYVEQVKIFYGDYLQEKQQDKTKRMAILAQKLNTFQDFVLIMKKQFEILDDLFAEKTKKGQKITIKFTPLDDYKFEEKKEK